MMQGTYADHSDSSTSRLDRRLHHFILGTLSVTRELSRDANLDVRWYQGQYSLGHKLVAKHQLGSRRKDIAGGDRE